MVNAKLSKWNSLSFFYYCYFSLLLYYPFFTFLSSFSVFILVICFGSFCSIIMLQKKKTTIERVFFSICTLRFSQSRRAHNGCQQGATFRYLRFHNVVREKHLILLNWHRFLKELVILNRKSLNKVLMLLRFLNIQWRLPAAFVIQTKHLFEEVTQWSGMLGEVRDKFSQVVDHTKKSLQFIN